MAADKMKSVVTFTIFSFLLLTVAMFLVFYRYDFYYTDTGTFIRIGFIMEDTKNVTKENQVADVKSHMQVSKAEDMLESVMNNPEKVPGNLDNSRLPPIRKSPFYEKFLAIMATRTHQPGETGGVKFPSGGDGTTTQSPSNVDTIRRMISKLDESSDARKSLVEITPTLHPILVKASSFSQDEVKTNVKPSTAKHPKPDNESSPSTMREDIKRNQDDRHTVSYPVQRLPTPVPAASPPTSWPSLFLPDSGFADSSEISPFSVFTRLADILNSKEDERIDSEEMWSKLDGITDFFASPRKRGLQEFSYEENPDEDSVNDYDETKDLFESDFQRPAFYIEDDYDDMPIRML